MYNEILTSKVNCSDSFLHLLLFNQAFMTIKMESSKYEPHVCTKWRHTAHWRDMYWSDERNLMNCGDLITSTSPVLLTSKCPHALPK